MPKPKKGETEREFLNRCIPELIEEGKYTAKGQPLPKKLL